MTSKAVTWIVESVKHVWNPFVLRVSAAKAWGTTLKPQRAQRSDRISKPEPHEITSKDQVGAQS